MWYTLEWYFWTVTYLSLWDDVTQKYWAMSLAGLDGSSSFTLLPNFGLSKHYYYSGLRARVKSKKMEIKNVLRFFRHFFLFSEFQSLDLTRNHCWFTRKLYTFSSDWPELLEELVLEQSKNGVAVVGERVEDEELVKDDDYFLRFQAGLLLLLIQRRPRPVLGWDEHKRLPHYVVQVDFLQTSSWVHFYHACLYVCLSVCLSARVSHKPHDQISSNVLCMLPVLLWWQWNTFESVDDVVYGWLVGWLEFNGAFNTM